MPLQIPKALTKPVGWMVEVAEQPTFEWLQADFLVFEWLTRRWRQWLEMVARPKSLIDPPAGEKWKVRPEPWVKLGIGGRAIQSRQ